MRTLLVGALAAETLPLIRRLDRPRPLGRRLVLGRLGDTPVAVLSCGVGPARAEARTRDALARWEADRVVSFGTAGALVDDLPVGTAVTASAVGELAVEPLGALSRVRLVTVDHAICTAEERAQLAPAQVCEMEAAGVLAAAGHRAFHAVKVVSDRAGGEPDPVFARGGMPRLLRVARFKLRALRLVEERLAGVLVEALALGEPASGG